MVVQLTRQAVSDASGTASLVVWIFAQSPQIYKNFRAKSVEGLSLVFLLQWTLGDLTNLVGAFLTHQLPIQIVIAAYMMLVDMTLCIQYAMYYRAPKPHHRHRFPTEHSPLLAHKSTKASAMGSMAGAIVQGSRNVLHSRPRQAKRAQSLDNWLVYRVKPSHRPKRVGHDRQLMANSLHEGWQPRFTASLDRTHRRAGASVHGSRRQSIPSSDAGSHDTRGRNRSARIRRGTAMALLGLGLYVSVGEQGWMEAPSKVDEPTIMGRAVVSVTHSPLSSTSFLPGQSWLVESPRHPIMHYLPDMLLVPDMQGSLIPGRRQKGPALPLSMLIGRISAWFCTLLYMTSRLPQIWENWRRKSVQGLSMLLFLLAFVANLFYSVSILANPKAVGPNSYEFLSESLPFLLGSCGTLVFDMIILIQYAMWHDKPAQDSTRTSFA